MSIITYMEYPDGRVPSLNETEQVLRFLLTISKWIEPKFYGSGEAEHPIPKPALGNLVDFLMRFYEQEGSITLVERGGLELIFAPPTPTLAAGDISWEAPPKHPALEQRVHMSVVWQLMQLIRAPLAESMDNKEEAAFSTRLVECDGYQEELPTVLGYRNGLRHAFWRMWFGAPYVSFFGKEKLESAPSYYKQALQPDGFFVQTYADPEEWSSPASRAASSALEKALGRKAFYDPEEPEAVLDIPDF
jgi:hypothetical protein